MRRFQKKKVKDLSANLISSTSHSIKGRRRREEIDNPKRGTVNKTSNNVKNKSLTAYIDGLLITPIGQALFGGRGGGGARSAYMSSFN